MSIHTCRVLITATDIESVPPKLVFFSNYEDGELGKGLYYCMVLVYASVVLQFDALMNAVRNL